LPRRCPGASRPRSWLNVPQLLAAYEIDYGWRSSCRRPRSPALCCATGARLVPAPHAHAQNERSRFSNAGSSCAATCRLWWSRSHHHQVGGLPLTFEAICRDSVVLNSRSNLQHGAFLCQKICSPASFVMNPQHATPLSSTAILVVWPCSFSIMRHSVVGRRGGNALMCRSSPPSLVCLRLPLRPYRAITRLSMFATISILARSSV
jgi:hypothetical protein